MPPWADRCGTTGSAWRADRGPRREALPWPCCRRGSRWHPWIPASSCRRCRETSLRACCSHRPATEDPPPPARPPREADVGAASPQPPGCVRKTTKRDRSGRSAASSSPCDEVRKRSVACVASAPPRSLAKFACVVSDLSCRPLEPLVGAPRSGRTIWHVAPRSCPFLFALAERCGEFSKIARRATRAVQLPAPQRTSR